MQKFNDSSLVSACLNYNLNNEQTTKMLSYREVEHFKSLKNEMYMSQYKFDFSPPRRSIITTTKYQTQMPRKLDFNSTCRCSKCLGI